MSAIDTLTRRLEGKREGVYCFRAFDKYTKDIKASLERGTALDDE